MEISRRDFLRFSVAAGGATALGGLIGSGVNLGPVVARAQELRIKGAKVTPSVCPYCSVGCATLVHTVDGKIVNIEGDPRSPHNEGTLCPEGRGDLSAPRQSQSSDPGAAPRARRDRLGGLGSRAGDGPRRRAGQKDPRRDVHREACRTASWSTSTPAIFSLGGATLDIEWNHIHQKLMRGLGIVAIENQARI